MSRLFQLKDDGPRAYRGLGIAARRGEVLAVDDEDTAESLAASGYFDEVDAGEADAENEEYVDEVGVDVAGEYNGEAESADDRDPNTPEEFDEDDWFDQEFGDRANAVEAGEVDDHLDAIDDAETSDTVRRAIENRRAELE